MENNDVQLPALEPKVNYTSVPRRYEETKPVLVRDLTHKSIITFGANVQKETLERALAEKDFCVKAAEEAVWAKAEVIKKEALEKALQKAKLEHEKAIRRLNKAHEKALMEEALRVAGEMQKSAMDLVQTEREEGEMRLQQAVDYTKKVCHQEKIGAVLQAREEEREIAAQKAVQTAREEKERFEKALKKAADEKADALQSLKLKMDNERAIAVTCMQQEQTKIAEKRLADLSHEHELKLQNLKDIISEKNNEILSLENHLEAAIMHKNAIAKELMETRQEFQTFIDKTSPFEKGKSDYLLPPAKSLIRDMERESTMFY